MVNYKIFLPLNIIITLNKKKYMFNNLISILSKNIPNPENSISIIQTIINDLPNTSNIQPENNLDASDILADLISYVDNDSFLILLYLILII